MKKLMVIMMGLGLMSSPIFAAGLVTDPGFETGIIADADLFGNNDGYYDYAEYTNQLWVYGSSVTSQSSGGSDGKYTTITSSGYTRGLGVVINDGATSTGEWVFTVDLKDEGVAASTVTLMAYGLPDPWSVTSWRNRITPTTWVAGSLEVVPLLSQTVDVSGVTDWTTFTETLDLGTTGYEYIAIAVTIIGNTSGNGLGVDNLDIISGAPTATTFIFR